MKIVQLVEAQNISDRAPGCVAMHGRGWRIVHLWRRNLLRQVLSTMVAEQRGYFVIRDQAPPPLSGRWSPTPPISFIGCGAEAVGTAEQEAVATVPHTTVCYEDDLIEPSRQQETLDRIAAFLGRTPGAARTDVQRTVTGPLSDVVANADEVIAALRGTEWERFLD